MLRVRELITYPVKGCAGTRLPAAVITAAGLVDDSAFMVTDPDGVFRSQRHHPDLARIRPRVDPGGTTLTLHAPHGDPITVVIDRCSPRRTVTLFGSAYLGIDQGEPVARWLTAILGVPSRLVRVPPEHHRVTDGRTPGTSHYADSCAIHMVSTASLADLNARITAAGNDAIPVRRLRPNIVIDGAAPYQEDQLHRCTVGAATLGFAKLAVRCAVALVNQDTGVRAGPEPLRTLSHYRRGPEGGVVFGAKFAVLRPGKVAAGDPVEPLHDQDFSCSLQEVGATSHAGIP